MVGLSSSSSSSSLKDQWEFHELIHAADEARQRYSNATREVGWLERCLDAIGVALKTSEVETTAMQAGTTDAQTHIVGEGSLCLVVILSSICSF